MEFPGIRKRCFVHSWNNGSIVVFIKRKASRRLYIKRREVDYHEEAARDNASTDSTLLNGANKQRRPQQAHNGARSSQQHRISSSRMVQPFTTDCILLRRFSAHRQTRRYAKHAFEDR
jgi:hypothetical protein